MEYIIFFIIFIILLYYFYYILVSAGRGKVSFVHYRSCFTMHVSHTLTFWGHFCATFMLSLLPLSCPTAQMSMCPDAHVPRSPAQSRAVPRCPALSCWSHSRSRIEKLSGLTAYFMLIAHLSVCLFSEAVSMPFCVSACVLVTDCTFLLAILNTLLNLTVYRLAFASRHLPSWNLGKLYLLLTYAPY